MKLDTIKNALESNSNLIVISPTKDPLKFIHKEEREVKYSELVFLTKDQ